jgi:hypothetical protein
MTEEQWLNGEDMLRMLAQAYVCAGNRKLRLFACACCQRFAHLLPTKAARRALSASEGAADGLTKFADLAAAKRAVPVLAPRNATEWASNCAHFSANRISRHAAFSAYSTSAEVVRSLGFPYESHERYYADLLRDIVGNPFRPVAFDPAWRSEVAVGIARGIYDERAFERMPILADALQEAGCEHPDILSHCREPGEHVRGCWVVDLVLGKE